ncbi:hypothetical protein JL721_5497 [Aureococcus anophagefferens]|nr:hypothetical protein JL721_5497 [Aureococcus anophagefferens]
MTNAAIGPHLVDAGHMRTLTRTIIESGAVDDDSAAAWHFESAKAMADGKLKGEFSLSSEALLKEGADAGIDMVVSVLGGAKTDVPFDACILVAA